MLYRMAKWFIALVLGIVFFTGTRWLPWWDRVSSNIFWTSMVLLTLTAVLIGLSIAPKVISAIHELVKWMETSLRKTPIQEIIGGAIGLIFGLIISNLFSSSLARIPIIGTYIPIAGSLLLGYVGWSVGTHKKEELTRVLLGNNRFYRNMRDDQELKIMLLDTSAIIDGRIVDICRTGFLEGSLVVASAVLDELRHIADSPDLLRRNRGRRGLDVLNILRQEHRGRVKIDNRELPAGDVDNRLVHLAKMTGASIVTNDYNLNKVAKLQGVKVLNINELANALKPVVLPGEEMTVQIIKFGKELGQGIGYLQDGTMIVVENGKQYMGKTVVVMVTSVLQTAAGRMIFARPREEDHSRTETRPTRTKLIRREKGTPPIQQESGDYQWST